MKKRGQKRCSKCNAANGARSFACKACSHPFSVKVARKKKVRQIGDWRLLEPNALIRVVSGSGPYYLDADGNRHYFSDRGVYRVVSIDNSGLHCYPESGGGHTYLYMGPEVKSDLCHNMWRAPHKLLTVNRRLAPS